MSETLYDQIGGTYRSTRRPDPRLAAAITSALGDAKIVADVGAGTGAYEPADRVVVAVEPSWRMIQQRSGVSSLVVQASAESLPFPDRTFGAALAVLTLHHWTDWRCGLEEMKRVAHRLVILTIDPRESDHFWLTEAYFPEIVALDRERYPAVDDIASSLGPCPVDHIAIPHACV